MTLTAEYEAAPFLNTKAPSQFETQEGDDFKFVFVNGYILEASSDPNSIDWWEEDGGGFLPDSDL